jgi:hypothetical protein
MVSVAVASVDKHGGDGGTTGLGTIAEVPGLGDGGGGGGSG